MFKSDLAEIIKAKHDLTNRKSADVVETIFETIVNELKKGGFIQIRDFGTFSVRDVAECERYDIHAKKKVRVPAHKLPKFTAGKNLKNAVR